MNTIVNIINTRRSVRKWADQEIQESDILEIIEAGMNAPSAINEQAWQFVVITDKALLEKYAVTSKNVSYIRNAKAAILICGDTRKQKIEGFYVHDCCAATENILLAIHAKGMGGVWGNVFPDSTADIRSLLGLPEHIIPFSVVPFGYPEGTPKYENRFDKEKLHFNKW